MTAGQEPLLDRRGHRDVREAQIEDLLGYPLPDLARSDPEWWTRVGTKAEPPLSEAWTMAGRTASPNLLAHTVMFERT